MCKYLVILLCSFVAGEESRYKRDVLPLGMSPAFHTVYPVPLHQVGSAAPVYTPHPGAKIGYNNQASGLGTYYGGSDLHSDLANKGYLKEFSTDARQVASKDGHGMLGNQILVRDDVGHNGFVEDKAARAYNQGGAGYYGGENKLDVEAKKRYGGAGNAGHRKGHKSSGFHKTYHNVESGKDTSFVDENHDVAEQKYGQQYGDVYDDRKWAALNEGHESGMYGHKVAEDAAARGALKSAGAHQANYDRLAHAGNFKNKDLVYNRAQLQSLRNNNFGAGNSGMARGYNGVHHNGYVV